MSRVLTASDVCASALRLIGAFPITESAPRSTDLREAMKWLDLILAETVGVDRIMSHVQKATLSFPITNGTSSYDFFATLGSDLPTDKIQYVTGAWLEDGDGNRRPLEIVQRDKFEDVPKPDETGPPCWVYIDRNQIAPELHIFPTPATTDTQTYTVKLTVQVFSPNVSAAGVTGTLPSASTAHNFGNSWQRWMIYRLAQDLGSGAISKLGEASLKRFQDTADASEMALKAFENREHETTPPINTPWGMD